jgi:hypothetical protein
MKSSSDAFFHLLFEEHDARTVPSSDVASVRNKYGLSKEVSREANGGTVTMWCSPAFPEDESQVLKVPLPPPLGSVLPRSPVLLSHSFSVALAPFSRDMCTKVVSVPSEKAERVETECDVCESDYDSVSENMSGDENDADICSGSEESASDLDEPPVIP